MNIITIINLFLLPSLITTLLLGAILNYKSIEINKYQGTLMTTFIYWALIMIYVYIKFFIDMQLDQRLTISFTSDVCSTQVLLLGTLCFVSLISYPVVVLEAKYLELKSWVERTKTTAITVAIYFVINLIAGTDPFIKYASLDELTSNINSASVISRLSLFVALVYIWSRELWRIWCLVPYYNQYIKDHFADSRCNVDCVRTLVKYISVVMCMYCTMLFFGSPLINLFYLTAVLVMFGYMIKMSLLHRTSEGIESINIMRNPQNPKDYIVVQADNSKAKFKQQFTPNEIHNQKTPANNLTLINEWMDKETPYTNTSFSTNDILEAFPQFTRYDLTILFRHNSETFQSYVRRFRIKKACEIMSSDNIYNHSQQIYAIVGFSHYSSYSRSFVALLNISPSKFMKLSDIEKQKYTETIRNFEL